MKIELPYFKIGNSFGGNQNWFRDPMMHLGGCAAATACDVCINMALYDNKSDLYPYDIHNLSKEDYIKFSAIMKPYLRPRLQGIDTLKLYIDGVSDYLKDAGDKDLRVTGFSGEMPVSKAAIEIKNQIDQKRTIPFLLLKHKNYNLKDFTWHWFLIVGYEEFEDEFYVKVATYGNLYADYSTCTEEAQRDLRANARPEFKHALDSIDEYDTIYLGYPNYWGTMPMHVYTFLEKYDFTGKTIKPLCTHEGSGMGRSESEIKKLCSGAKVEIGLAIHGGSVSSAKNAIEKWI